MQHHKSSDGHRAFPWQHVLVLSILQLARSPGNRTTVQMQVSSQKLLPWLGSTSRIVSRLVVMSMQHEISFPTNPNDFPPIAVIHILIYNLLMMSNRHCLCESCYFIHTRPQGLQNLTFNLTGTLNEIECKLRKAFRNVA